MKRLIKFLLVLTMLAGMFFAMGAAKYKPQPQPKIDHTFEGVPKGVTIIEDTWDVVYGDPSPKLRFAVGGVEMQEGVDFEYRYRPSGTSRDYVSDYRDCKDAGCFYDLAVYIKNEWANNLVNEYLTIEGTRYDHVIAYFYVYELDLSNCQYNPIPDKEYSLHRSNPDIGNITYNGYVLDPSTYHVYYRNTDNPLEYYVLLEPHGFALTGELKIPYKYTPKPLSSCNYYVKVPDKYSATYTGKELEPKISLYIEEGYVVAPKDYKIISFENILNAGKAKVTIEGQNKYSGICEYEFDILPRDISDFRIKVKRPYYAYTGKSIKPDPEIWFEGYDLKYQLIEGKDYEISISPAAIEQGEYTYTITGIGNFTGTRTEKFSIKWIDISICDIPVVKFNSTRTESLSSLVVPDVTYNGNKVKYQLDLEGCTKDPGVHKYKIYGMGDYTGCVEGTYIVRQDITDYNIICGDKVYTGKPITPKLVLQRAEGEKTIYVDPAEFYTTFYNNTDVGQVKVTVVSARNLYYGHTISYFNIVPASILDCKVSYKKSFFYDGINPVKPELTITYNDMTLVEGKDYTVSYSNNTVIGKDTGKITITGIGNFKDTDVYTFDIHSKNEPTSSVSPAAGVTAAPSTAATSTTAPQTTGAPAASTPSSNTQFAVSEETKSATSEFVARIYTYVLGREPEADGLAFWSDELISFRRTGAEVAQGFIFSEEFENRNTSDSEFVTILYKTFFGRDPEEEGLNYWLTQLSTGAMDRATVANGFIYSQEWADTCASYGIRSGGDLKPSGKIEPTELTYAFVERMYTTALGRSYDEEGKQYWASELANFNVTGELVGAAFFLSNEMTGYGVSDKEFLNRLYATFMDREPDADGSDYWLTVMASGAPRADVVFGFTRSPEFTERCVEARILPY